MDFCEEDSDLTRAMLTKALNQESITTKPLDLESNHENGMTGLVLNESSIQEDVITTVHSLSLSGENENADCHYSLPSTQLISNKEKNGSSMGYYFRKSWKRSENALKKKTERGIEVSDVKGVIEGKYWPRQNRIEFELKTLRHKKALEDLAESALKRQVYTKEKLLRVRQKLCTTENSETQKPFHTLVPVDNNTTSSSEIEYAEEVKPQIFQGSIIKEPPVPRTRPRGKPPLYEPYVSTEELMKGLEEKRFLKGVLRVAQSNTDQAYITVEESRNSLDYIVVGRRNRNRALHTSRVAFEILDEQYWVRVKSRNENVEDETYEKEDREIDLFGTKKTDLADLSERALYHKAVRVVYVFQKENDESLQVSCILRSCSRAQGTKDQYESHYFMLDIEENAKFVRAMPLDKRYTWMLVSSKDVARFEQIPGRLDPKNVYAVVPMNWNEFCALPYGRIIQRLDSVAEYEGLKLLALAERSFWSHISFSKAAISEAEYHVEQFPIYIEEERYNRLELDNYLVFTIDPKGAKDFDDAISVRVKSEEPMLVYEIGIHISDVSFYVKPYSALDVEAKKRFVTLYMPNETYNLFPSSLSENVCSLIPGENRLTFSIFYYITKDGQFSREHKPRFAKSIINSCCRLTYKEVDKILKFQNEALSNLKPENKNNVSELEKAMSEIEAPTIVGLHSWNDLWKSLVLLEDLTKKMRKERFKNNGSIEFISSNSVTTSIECLEAVSENLQNDKVLTVPVEELFRGFSYDEDNSTQSSGAHNIIEELMLMANKVVAKRIVKSSFKDVGIFRNLIPPRPEAIRETKAFLSNSLGLKLEFSPRSAFCESLRFLREKLDKYLYLIIERLLLRSLSRVEYVTYGSYLHHFCLNFQVYTHFTSPIRRYVDVLVQRQLEQIIVFESQYDRIGGANELWDSDIGLVKETKTELTSLLAKASRAGYDGRSSPISCACFFVSKWLREKNILYATLTSVITIQELHLRAVVPGLHLVFSIYFDNNQSQLGDLVASKILVYNRIEALIKERIVLPYLIERVEENKVIAKWEYEYQVSDDSTPKKLYINQILRPLAPTPVYFVSTDTIPPKLEAMLVPPWKTEFTESLLNNNLLDHKKIEVLQHELNMQLSSATTDSSITFDLFNHFYSEYARL